MPVFISYSHKDAEFANKLAMHLVGHNAHVWIDSWELNVGDSILSRVQQAIQDSSALLIVLSKASVASEWCKKELNAALMRELDEKRVVVLPVLIEDCEIPPFLREKKYADFRTDFDTAIHDVVEALAGITSTDQGRLRSGNTTIDWSETWGYADSLLTMEYTLVEFSPDLPFTLLTQVSLICNDVLTDRYKQYEAAGLDWVGRIVIADGLTELAAAQDVKILLEDQFPKSERYILRDPRSGREYRIIVTCRRMGQDNGKDQLVNIGNYLRHIREYVRKRARKPTEQESQALITILARS